MKENAKRKAKNKKLRKVKLLILDVDGVMTDGSIIYDNRGNEYKIFNAHDGYGIELAQKAGIRIAFVSGKKSDIIDRRAEILGVEDVYQGITDKNAVLKELLIKYKLDQVEVCAIGDDLLDLGMMKNVGFPVAVRNARPEVKRIAKYITDADGGKGAIREVTDLLVQAR